ncbi:glycoside hydrolase family 125 protein [Paenibacillus sp. GP183]|uniref:glycoside hydrolase family 125 protein n=1 Tax=Paenibacillus sp. GP183 TaxID=1882751 RepID=UPI000B82EB3A|nr:glycoside hydrolase family 125 protein [Paenibacillus sp. GP183]
MQNMIRDVQERLVHRPKLSALFENCYPNTYQTTLKKQPDGTTFVITGDIPAMWLRDSAAQVHPYVSLASHDEQMLELLTGVIQRQIRYILHDAYANAFNETDNVAGHQTDLTDMSPLVWERKYEIDSLCYPIWLAYRLWTVTGSVKHLNEQFWQAADSIIELWTTEQHHEERSAYRFERLEAWAPHDTLSQRGPVAYTGMTWSGFRPSDDSCEFGYLIPANMFAVVVLEHIAEMAEALRADADQRIDRAKKLSAQIRSGIENYGTVEHPEYGKIYAYETDGRSNYILMDDANIPSLLSSPYLGYCKPDDLIYLNTRRFILSSSNPYYCSGGIASGVGSQHTPQGYIWHLALSMQGLTSLDPQETERILEMLERTDAETGYMHEGFHADDPSKFTRPWFAWSNSLFSELVMKFCGM